MVRRFTFNKITFLTKIYSWRYSYFILEFFSLIEKVDEFTMTTANERSVNKVKEITELIN